MSTTETKTKPRATPKLARRQQQILETAARLARPGEPVSGAEIATSLGMQLSYVYQVIRQLKAKGLWPYVSFRGYTTESPQSSSLERETDAIRIICLKLAGLPDEAARKRVLAYCENAGAGRN